MHKSLFELIYHVLTNGKEFIEQNLFLNLSLGLNFSVSIVCVYIYIYIYIYKTMYNTYITVYCVNV